MKKIVTLSGGSGGFTLLRGLAEYPISITSIATVFDSGGSTGILRDAYGALPQGDLRRCLLALIPNNSKWREAFMHRFAKNGFLKNHPLGNLMLFAFEEIWGRDEAVQVLGELLHARGRVLPVSTDNAHLIATLEDGTDIFTESEIDMRDPTDKRTIQSVRLDQPATASRSVCEAIAEADYIIIGPGDLYTSLIPNLLAKGVPEAINASTAPIIYVANLMTKACETGGYVLEQFLEALHKHGITRIIEHVVHTREPIAHGLARTYWEKEGSEEVILSDPTLFRQYCSRYSISSLQSLRAAREGIVRHSAHKLGRAIMNIIEDRHADQILIIDLDDTLIETTQSYARHPDCIEKMTLVPGALDFLVEYPGRRILLTAGNLSLQHKKLELMNLYPFLDEWHVVDTLEDKYDAIRTLMSQAKNPKDVLVVGDRADGELHFGCQLGCTTARICLPEGKYAKHPIPPNDNCTYTASDFTVLMTLLARTAS